MACNHKFLNITDRSLLPKWPCKTLIIGTFNPENRFHRDNTAKFFYQRERNYFWDVLPLISGDSAIEKQNTEAQIDFLRRYGIGITDLLLSIRDADSVNQMHANKISTVKDSDIESFNEFEWNTDSIIDFINHQQCTHVYFTKLGTDIANPAENSFEFQMRLIESFCLGQGIVCHRLHTPTGMGLGPGQRIPTLYRRWIQENGANQMPFYKE
mgnify:FL=1